MFTRVGVSVCSAGFPPSYSATLTSKVHTRTDGGLNLSTGLGSCWEEAQTQTRRRLAGEDAQSQFESLVAQPKARSPRGVSLWGACGACELAGLSVPSPLADRYVVTCPARGRVSTLDIPLLP